MKFPAALLALALFVPALAQSPAAVRDPFVYGLRAPEKPVVRPVVVTRPEQSKPAQQTAAVQEAAKPAVARPAAPAVTVTGIVSGPAQTAILSNAGRSYLVRIGDRLGDYRVSAIGPRSVTLATGANSFKLPLE